MAAITLLAILSLVEEPSSAGDPDDAGGGWHAHPHFASRDLSLLHLTPQPGLVFSPLVGTALHPLVPHFPGQRDCCPLVCTSSADGRPDDAGAQGDRVVGLAADGGSRVRRAVRALANPAISLFFSRVWDHVLLVIDWISQLAFTRMFLWVVVIVAAYGLLRHRHTWKKRVLPPPVMATNPSWGWQLTGPQMIVRLLIVMNAIIFAAGERTSMRLISISVCAAAGSFDV